MDDIKSICLEQTLPSSSRKPEPRPKKQRAPVPSKPLRETRKRLFPHPQPQQLQVGSSPPLSCPPLPPLSYNVASAGLWLIRYIRPRR